jgi:hypothetical protein
MRELKPILTINRGSKEITMLLHVIRKKFTVRSQLSGYASTRGAAVALASRRFALGIKTKGRTEKEKNQEGERRPPQRSSRYDTLVLLRLLEEDDAKKKKGTFPMTAQSSESRA